MIPIETLLGAYRIGFFPMGTDERTIEWFSPDPRCILPLERFHLPRRLVRKLKAHPVELSVDRAFDEVIRACASRGDEGDWITAEIQESYCALHRAGFAHSVEVWKDGRLVGGLYGVSLRGAFFGESMFHRVSDGSKVALWALVERLRERGYRLLDTQWLTPHLERLGAIEIPRALYLELLEDAMQHECRFE